jgi:ribosomal-protein-alanine N-acetyltransferase
VSPGVASPPTRLRPFLPSDFETLYRIDQICFPRGISYGRFEMKVYLRAKGSFCLLAEAAGNVAGFILAELAPDEGHIVTLDVLEEYRRKGIGSQLLAAAEAEASSRGGWRMVLETATTNEAAIALWKKHGYRRLGILEDYYGRGNHAYRMEKELVALRDLKPDRLKSEI